MERLKRDEAILVVIDLQERLVPAMSAPDALVAAADRLLRGCRILEIPALVTQQYTKGLGMTLPALAEALTAPLTDAENTGQAAKFSYIDKTAFSAMGEPAFVSALRDSGRKSVILCGVEAHVCVLQTALDLIQAGYSVFIVDDCAMSRQPSDKDVAMRRLIHAGAVPTTAESVLFELLVGATEPGFRQISRLVK